VDFKYSPELTVERKAKIRRDLNEFGKYLSAIGLDLPQGTPMVAIVTDGGGIGRSADEEPAYYDEIMIPKADIDNRYAGVPEYSGWVVSRLVGIGTPPRNRSFTQEIANAMTKDMWYRQIFPALIARYFSDSFLGKQSTADVPLSNVFWNIRSRCHNADRWMAFSPCIS
jgi:hypothetical protein